MQTFFWHDYETFGVDPVHDRPAQFAGVRTDLDFNIIGDPLLLYCRPADDYLPDPQACLITGITPQHATKAGVCEAEFIAAIQAAFSQPETCVVGYNSLRFDDEVTRHTLFRNLRDPYAREWQQGNSRWDIIDMVRLTYALRPEGIEWPCRDDGSVSFKLESLTAANGITHEAAHDAMSDVYATIALARLIKTRQPRLFDYVLANKGKAAARAMLNVRAMKPVLHVSSRYPAALGACALVAPLADHPDNPNAVIVFDLRQDPTELIHASVEDIQRRLFTQQDQLPDGEQRFALKAVHVNKCSILAPATLLSDLSPDHLQRLQLDGALLRKHLQQLRDATGLAEKLVLVFQRPGEGEAPDVDASLYAGGFISPADRRKLDGLLRLPPEALGEQTSDFADARLAELLFRYRARNYPHTLNEPEMARWERFRKQRLMQPGPGWRSLQQYAGQIEALSHKADLTERQMAVLQDLHIYGESLLPY